MRHHPSEAWRNVSMLVCVGVLASYVQYYGPGVQMEARAQCRAGLVRLLQWRTNGGRLSLREASLSDTGLYDLSVANGAQWHGEERTLTISVLFAWLIGKAMKQRSFEVISVPVSGYRRPDGLFYVLPATVVLVDNTVLVLSLDMAMSCNMGNSSKVCAQRQRTRQLIMATSWALRRKESRRTDTTPVLKLLDVACGVRSLEKAWGCGGTLFNTDPNGPWCKRPKRRKRMGFSSIDEQGEAITIPCTSWISSLWRKRDSFPSWRPSAVV